MCVSISDKRDVLSEFKYLSLYNIVTLQARFCSLPSNTDVHGEAIKHLRINSGAMTFLYVIYNRREEGE